MKPPAGREVLQLRNNPDPLVHEYLQHMDLVYRMYNVNFATVRQIGVNEYREPIMLFEVPIDCLKSYLYHPLTLLPFIWRNYKEPEEIQVIRITKDK